MAAKIVGCKNIIAVDIVPEKLKLAEEIGATHTINGKEATDVVEEIKTITNVASFYFRKWWAVPHIVYMDAFNNGFIGGRCWDQIRRKAS